MKKSIFKLALCLAFVGTLTSCWILYGPSGGGGPLGSNRVVTTPNYVVELLEVVGNRSAQEVRVVIMVTNRQANQNHVNVGGQCNGTEAIDDQGRTSKPHSCSGVTVNLPTNVPVRVSIERFSPVFNTNRFRHLQINIGHQEQNRAVFRNVPILWE